MPLQSYLKVFESTTVGTPIAITGTPKVSKLSLFLEFPTPDPGEIPVSDSCMVLHSLDGFLAARASITIIA